MAERKNSEVNGRCGGGEELISRRVYEQMSQVNGWSSCCHILGGVSYCLTGHSRPSPLSPYAQTFLRNHEYFIEEVLGDQRAYHLNGQIRKLGYNRVGLIHDLIQLLS